MAISSFEPLAKTVAINSITAYQKYISGAKGFSCPHRLLHGGDSCSDSGFYNFEFCILYPLPEP
ncbi:hypothetical protein H6G32_03605 [Cylindrospermum sp. FACHB-282]|nr:hypothetical protein [Cylindrospermum sp. FACHB-282]